MKENEQKTLLRSSDDLITAVEQYGFLPFFWNEIHGFSVEELLKVTIDTISGFLLENEMTVYIIIFNRKAYQISGKLFADIAT
jgi:hypothetical protein